MERLQRLFSSVGGGAPATGPQGDTAQVDTAEQVYISSLALLKMLKHGGCCTAPRLGGGNTETDKPFCACLLRASGCAYGGDGPHAGRVCGRLHRQGGGRVRHAPGARLALLSPLPSLACALLTLPPRRTRGRPQSGTGVSVEAVDPVFQTKMLDMLKQTGRCVARPTGTRRAQRGPCQDTPHRLSTHLAPVLPCLLSPPCRPEMVVGWYHSHPGFGCWLSGVDMNTQQSFEALNARAVAVVVDPVQSVKGNVVIDAFRLINPQTMMLGQEPRQTTSNLGHLNKPSIQALIHGLNRHYYSLGISYRKNALEEQMLLNLHKPRWSDSLALKPWDQLAGENGKTVEELKELAARYEKAVTDEDRLSARELVVQQAGKQDAKKHLESAVHKVMGDNIVQTLGAMLDVVAF